MYSPKSKDDADLMQRLVKRATRPRTRERRTLDALFDMPFRDPLPSFERRIREGITVDPRSYVGLLELNDL